MIPPGENLPGAVDRRAEEIEPRGPELRLMSEHRGRPLGGRPDARKDDREYDKNLADEQSGGGHGSAPEERKAAPVEKLKIREIIRAEHAGIDEV